MADKRIVIWCGSAPNHRALAGKIAKEFPIAGIVIDRKFSPKKKRSLKEAVTALQNRFFFKQISAAWNFIQQEYRHAYPAWPNVPVIEVDSINSEKALVFTRGLQPDLIVVSGTGLVKKDLLALKPTIGIINLHTGLSPYIKGGPNCTNWCISTAQFEKIGSTIMWINEGIDSGNIISSETIKIYPSESLNEIHWRVMEHAHELYLNVIRYLFKSSPPFNSISQQQISPGKLYLTRMWNFAAKRALKRNLKTFQKGRATVSTELIQTVSLNNKH